MALPQKRQPREVLQQWVDSVLDQGERMTDWELHFAESIADQLEFGSGVSERQEEILERLYVDKVR